MAGSVKLYTLGHSGVIVDQHPMEPGVPDDSFEIAQNMTHDPNDGKGGAVCKRPGLAKFNLIGLGGVILGGIPMPVAGLGGAPATGGGSSTGDDAGTGDGTGGMGGTFDGGSAAYGSVGASIFGGGSGGSGSIFSGSRLLVIGYANTAVTVDGVGWWVTSKQMANSANLVLTPGPPGASQTNIADVAQYGYIIGRPSAITPDNFCYYAKADTYIGNAARQIRRTNGAVDQTVGTIPLSLVMVGGGSVQFQSIVYMAYGEDGNIYVCVSDEFGAHISGRIMKISGGVISEVNPGGPGAIGRYARTPSCCATFEGRLFWGTLQDVNDTSAEINCTTLDQAYSLADYAPVADQRLSGITCMLNSGGVLYAGTRDKTAGVAMRALILIRQPGKAIGAIDAWSTYDINVDPALPTPNTANTFVSMVEFNGAIYVSWDNTSGASAVANIYKCTPGVVSGVTSFSDVVLSYNDTNTVTGVVGYMLWVDDGVLYAIGRRSNRYKFLWTTDGVTWTDASANFSHPNAAFPLPVVFGLDQ